MRNPFLISVILQTLLIQTSCNYQVSRPVVVGGVRSEETHRVSLGANDNWTSTYNVSFEYARVSSLGLVLQVSLGLYPFLILAAASMMALHSNSTIAAYC
jgi:hypothetical protein